MRDVQQDPQPGDIVQVYPARGRELPLPMKILSVDDDGVRWQREGQDERFTTWGVWCANGREANGREIKLVQT